MHDRIREFLVICRYMVLGTYRQLGGALSSIPVHLLNPVKFPAANRGLRGLPTIPEILRSFSSPRSPIRSAESPWKYSPKRFETATKGGTA